MFAAILIVTAKLSSSALKKIEQGVCLQSQATLPITVVVFEKFVLSHAS